MTARVEKVLINYTGWIAVAKEDLKLIYIGDLDGETVDTTNLSVEEIASMLTKGDAVIECFGDAHKIAIDGEDDWTYESEVDEED